MSQTKLKIQGGLPSFPEGPPQWPVADTALRQSVNEALSSGQWGKYDGDLTLRLQSELQTRFSARHSLLCSSGTISVELALRGAGVKSGDEVILSAYDFPGNFRCIEAIGATPVLVDVVRDGWVMDHLEVTQAISEKTSAIVVSHLHGQIAKVEKICDIAESKGIKVVEDVCQSPGASLDGKTLGSFGDVATYSFGGSKLLSAGRGGAIASDDDGIIQRAKVFAHRGNDAFPLSQIQAALLLPQLQQLDSRNLKRQAAAQKIAEAVNRLDDFIALEISEVADAQAEVGGFYKLPIMIAEDSSIDRSRFLSIIQAEGVAMDIGFRGFAKRSARRCRAVGDLSNARLAATQTMLLHHPILLADDEQVERLMGVLKRCHEFCRND